MNRKLHLQMCHSFHPFVQTDLMWEVYPIAVAKTPRSKLNKFGLLRGDQFGIKIRSMLQVVKLLLKV